MSVQRYAPLTLAIVLGTGVLSNAAAGEPELFPRAKLLCKIPVGFGTETLFYSSSDGLRIVDLVYDKDPAEIIRKLPVGEFVPGKLPPGVKEMMANPRKVHLWDAANGKEVDAPAKDLFLNDYKYNCISPDGTKRVKIEELDPIVNKGGFPTPGPGITKPFRYKVTLLDLKTNKALYTVNPMSSWTRPAVRFTSDSAVVALIADSECTLHKPGAEKPTQKFKVSRQLMKTPYGSRPAPVEMIALFSVDGSRLGISVDGVVRVYDAAKGSVVFETTADAKAAKMPVNLEQVPFAFAASMKDPQLLVARSSGELRLFDLTDKKEKWRSQLPNQAAGGGGAGFGGGGGIYPNLQPYFNGKDEPRAFFVEQGRYDAANKNFPFIGKFVDAAAAKVIAQFESKGQHRYLLSPDGQYLVRTSFEKERFEGKRTVEVWNVDKAGEK